MYSTILAMLPGEIESVAYAGVLVLLGLKLEIGGLDECCL